jgi:hypothetical protein
MTDGALSEWGWQCFTCGAERSGYDLVSEVEQAMAEHELTPA